MKKIRKNSLKAKLLASEHREHLAIQRGARLQQELEAAMAQLESARRSTTAALPMAPRVEISVTNSTVNVYNA